MLKWEGPVGDECDPQRAQFAYDTSPAISPDGARVAYATLRHSEESGQFDIVTAALNGEEQRRLTQAWGSNAQPAWSPDGTRIAFLHGNWYVWSARLYTMAADGSGVRSLAPDIEALWEPAAWSPDGKRLAFRSPYGETASLYVVDSDGSNLTRAATGLLDDSTGGGMQRPVWSPNGRYVAFVGSDNPNREFLNVLDVASGAVEAIARGRFGRLVWSPGGGEIIYVSYSTSAGNERISESGLFAVAVEGERSVRTVVESPSPDLERALTRDPELAWSSDGARLAVLTTREPAREARGSPYIMLFTVAADGSDLRVLVRVGADGELMAAGEAAR